MRASSPNRVIARRLIAVVLAVAGCSSPGPTVGPYVGGSPTPSNLERVVGWRADLAALLPEMDRLHPALDHGVSRSSLDAAVAELNARVPDATDDEIMVGVLRVVAMVSARGCDAHTGAFVWGTGQYPVSSLPLRLWWFDEGIYIVDALGPDQSLIGSRIDSIAGHRIGDVLAALDPVIPRDNQMTVRLLMPRYLLIPEILRGLGLAPPGRVGLGIGLGVVRPDGSRADVTIDPIAMADYNAWAGPYGLHLPIDPKVEYLSRIGDALWWDRLPDGTIFVQQNRVERTSAAQLEPLRTALHAKGITRVVVDLRHNYGGEVSGIAPFLALFQDPAVDRAGRFFVVTGRNTFSAASLLVAKLDETTGATIVGEPMGGCPTAYGNPDELTLPYSGIVVDVAGQLEVGVSADDRRPTIEPDLAARLTPELWRSGLDPALEAIDGRSP